MGRFQHHILRSRLPLPAQGRQSTKESISEDTTSLSTEHGSIPPVKGKPGLFNRSGDFEAPLNKSAAAWVTDGDYVQSTNMKKVE